MIDYKKLEQDAKREGIIKFVVGAILTKGNKILFLKRPKDDFMGGIFELPSGNLELNETFEEGLRREVLEETGLRIKFILKYLDYFDYPSGSGKKTRQFNFLVSLLETEPVKLSEHDSYVWTEAENVGNYPITDNVKQIVKIYQDVNLNR